MGQTLEGRQDGTEPHGQQEHWELVGRPLRSEASVKWGPGCGSRGQEPQLEQAGGPGPQ